MKIYVKSEVRGNVKRWFQCKEKWRDEEKEVAKRDCKRWKEENGREFTI